MGTSNGDTNRVWKIGTEVVRGVGSFHKTLPHNKFGEVDPAAFAALVSSTRGDGREFAQVPLGAARDTVILGKDGKKIKKVSFAAALTNPQAGLASDRLTHEPAAYVMPPAPGVTSNTAAAEMVELYWMAIFRDQDLCKLDGETVVDGVKFSEAVDEINDRFEAALRSNAVAGGVYDNPDPPNADGAEDRFILGVDVPDLVEGGARRFTDRTLFRLGFPGDDVGPMVSQFFLRPAAFGTQTIDQRQRPYKAGLDYLTAFDDWCAMQNAGVDQHGQAYPKSNEDGAERYEDHERYIATMRDLARFVNKDALHQAYFNAALILLSGQAKWPLGNPYHDLGNSVVKGALPDREAGFGVLGGPHILALVSEVATRALKVVWRQKWQAHLRLRPEAYGGLVHVENLGVGGTKRAYGLPDWLAASEAVRAVRALNKTLNKKNQPINKKNDADCDTMLLPMAFTAGSPTHPAYGAGHATVAGACVTVLKAFFLTYATDSHGNDIPVRFDTLCERGEPYGPGDAITAYCTTLNTPKKCIETCMGTTKHDNRVKLDGEIAKQLTIEGELNKLAQNVAMGRSMGGVHWRTDNTRSLMLGEALAAEILARITTDVNEKPSFTFRTFSRKADGKPKKVLIERGRIFVDGVEKIIPVSML